MKRKNLLAVLGLSTALALSGCEDLPDDECTPITKHTTIVYKVEGSGGIDHADIIYGDKRYLGNDNFLTWLCTTQLNVPLPRDYTNLTSIGHPVRLAVNANNPSIPGNVVLTIMDTTNKQAYVKFFLHPSYSFDSSYAYLEYDIPSN